MALQLLDCQQTKRCSAQVATRGSTNNSANGTGDVNVQLQSVQSMGTEAAALWVNCSSPAVFKVRLPGSTSVLQELSLWLQAFTPSVPSSVPNIKPDMKCCYQVLLAQIYTKYCRSKSLHTLRIISVGKKNKWRPPCLWRLLKASV